MLLLLNLKIEMIDLNFSIKLLGVFYFVVMFFNISVFLLKKLIREIIKLLFEFFVILFILVLFWNYVLLLF